MARSNNQVLGHYQCPTCNQSSEVLQARRGAGRYLYRRGCGCGTDQRNGAEVQTEWWNNTVWLEGQPDAPPANLLVAEPEAQPDAEPELSAIESEPEPAEGEESTGKSGLLWLGGGILALAALLKGSV